jgi:DNA repair protein RecO (recombination protein O)
MHLLTPAIICAVRPHGEHGAIVRALTPADGIQAGFVRGGRSRRLRPILLAGNLVQAEYRARTEDQLAQLSVELAASRAPLLGEALPAAAIEWTTALAATALPEGQPYPRLYEALDGLLAAIEASPSARSWAPSLVRYELFMLAELGFGLDLTECAATGATEDLAFVSPKSGRAVSAAAAAGYRDRLFPLPPLLLGGGAAEWKDILAGLRITGHFLARDVLIERQADVLAGRERLLHRLKRAGG